MEIFPKCVLIKKLEDYYKNKIISELKKIDNNNSGKLVFYSKICKDFELQKYLNFEIAKDLRCLLTRIRIGAHSLAIEIGRYSKPKIPSNQRFCMFCKDKVEDEVHFLFECPQYSHIRSNYQISFLNTNNFDTIKEKLNPKSSQELKRLCLYIKEALYTRDHLSVN